MISIQKALQDHQNLPVIQLNSWVKLLISNAFIWLTTAKQAGFKNLRRGFLVRLSFSSFSCALYSAVWRYAPWSYSQTIEQALSNQAKSRNSAICAFCFVSRALFPLAPLHSFCLGNRPLYQLLCKRALQSSSMAFAILFAAQLRSWYKLRQFTSYASRGHVAFSTRSATTQ